ncbi:MAG: hypothetical protein AAF577_01965 [Pseudomonadota bacterium]
MPEAPEETLRDIIMQIATSKGGDFNKVMSAAVKKALASHPQGPFDAPAPVEISKLKRALAAEYGPVDYATLQRLNPRDLWSCLAMPDGKLPAVADFDVYWWFQYFYTEAWTGQQRDPVDKMNYALDRQTRDRKALVALMAEMFERNHGSPPILKLKLQYASPIGGASGPAARAPYEVWRDALQRLLKMGFLSVPVSDMAPDTRATGVASLMLNPSTAEFVLQKQYVGYLNQTDVKKGKSEIFVGWRCETRPLHMVRAHGGNKRQIDVDAIASGMNMDAAWHPFSDPAIKKFMWFRLANTDNDYYTVISVAENFRTAASFPLIDERRVYTFPNKDVSRWTQQEAERHRRNLALVEITGGEKRMMLASETYAYLYGITGLFLRTNAAGKNYSGGVSEAFPEIGVKEIPLDAIVGCLPLLRIHHGPSDKTAGTQSRNDGFTVFVQKATAALTTSDMQMLHRFGKTAYAKLISEYNTTLAAKPLASCWAGSGFKDPGTPVSVARVIEHPIRKQTLDDFKKTLATV